MAAWTAKRKIRRQQVREQRAKTSGTWRTRFFESVASWPILISILFIIAATAIALLGEATLGYSIGQRVDEPIHAQVGFEVPDEEQTAADREAARASTPSYYSLNATALTFDRIRADLMRLYQAASGAETFDDYRKTVADTFAEYTEALAETFPEYNKTLKETGWFASAGAYERLRAMGDEAGRGRFQTWVNELPLEREYVVRDLLREPRDPKSATDFIRLEVRAGDEIVRVIDVPHADLVPHGNKNALRGTAAAVARRFPMRELIPTVEGVVLAAFHDQPTIVYNHQRSVAAMRTAEAATPVAVRAYEKGKTFISPGRLGSEQYGLLEAHHAAYLAFLERDDEEASRERQARWLQRAGLVTIVTLLSVGLLMYAKLHHPRIFEIRARTLAFAALILGCLLAARALDIKWPQFPELAYAPCLFSASVLAIVYPRRLAVGVMCIAAVIVTTTAHKDIVFLLALFTGIALAGHQLDEVRSRTKLISSGLVTAAGVMIASAGGGLMAGHPLEFFELNVPLAGVCAVAAAFVLTGVLPFVERMFRIATSLALLEWRDPTRHLLQLLAREAPGTYNHSLVAGTLAAAACESIGANGLLAQVGALYHDIGKIHKADYFAENQEGQISRHDNLAPTMSLLIILGHVKDGIEMAKEYKLPRVLHQFIEEHHGTTVVRYFHHVASEKQPHIAVGKHDREVPEAEFRYAGPKPRSRESAVLMLSDGVEGAVRALQEPTPGRIESVVHQVVTNRLNDGQFDDCDITLKEIRRVEESLVKSLCGIHHGRVPYPKPGKPAIEAPAEQERVSV
jgi:hypothetical protein